MPNLDPAVARFSDVAQLANQATPESTGTSATAEELHNPENRAEPQPTTPELRNAEKETVKAETLKLILQNSTSPKSREAVAKLFDENMGEELDAAQVKQLLEAAESQNIVFVDIPKVGDTVEVNKKGIMNGSKGVVSNYDPMTNKLTVNLQPSDGGDPIPVEFSPAELFVIDTPLPEAMDTEGLKQALTGSISKECIDALSEEMTKVAGNDWMLTGSSAIKLWAGSLGVEFRDPGDIDLLVKQEAFENARFGLGKVFEQSSDSKTSVSYSKEEMVSVDLTRSRMPYGSLDQKEELDGVPVQSLEGLLISKENALKSGSKKEDKIKNDIEIIKNLIELKSKIFNLSQLENDEEHANARLVLEQDIQHLRTVINELTENQS
ncbi:hypothetical protein [Pleionea sediminis]|uniref:hypothetical protein n=1 Tax=Pleionea sediminis TaxID=2569479 RepID=UPI0011847000|nr:hypothetical protein [Pleionea sediminis]